MSNDIKRELGTKTVDNANSQFQQFLNSTYGNAPVLKGVHG